MRVSASEIAEAKANIAIYAAHVKLRYTGNWAVGNCPFHQDKNPSFAIRFGRWRCFACRMGGDTIAFLQQIRQIDFPTAVKELARGASSELAGRALERSPRAARIPLPSSGKSAAPLASIPQIVKDLWRTADAPRLAELYLYSRGLTGPLPKALRGHEKVWCTESGRHRPATLAALTDSASNITALQFIWCEHIAVVEDGAWPAKGSRPTDLRTPKKIRGQMRDGAVRLAEPRAMLGLAEGVETALSAAKLFKVPVWAALGAHRLGAITLPHEVRTIVVFGDNGAAGEKAAAIAVSAYRRRGFVVETVFPELGYSDFNDQLMRSR